LLRIFHDNFGDNDIYLLMREHEPGFGIVRVPLGVYSILFFCVY